MDFGPAVCRLPPNNLANAICNFPVFLTKVPVRAVVLGRAVVLSRAEVLTRGVVFTRAVAAFR